jgi:hypothetical protein
MYARTSWLGLVFLLSVFLLPSTALAQGSISGLVKDTTGAVLPGVTVEAASPVLIEKVRTTISDSSGRYQIIDLRPGSYTVTFTLPGFNTVKRDGVAIAGSGNAVVDADLRVGALEETVTVTGEAPVVDTQSITQQRVLNSEMVDALPSARNYFGLARMIPGTLGGGNDVGGSLIQDVGQSVIAHGSKNVDQRVTVNGVNTMTLQAGGNIGGQTPDVGSASEVTVDTTNLSADLPTGGVRINFVPKDGGNRFSNSTFLTFANDSMQGDNFSDELRAAGLGTPNKLVNAFDINESIGGPFKQNKVWFWFSTRYNTTENSAPVFANKFAYDPVNFYKYEPDTSNPGVNKGTQINSSLRVTWQASPRNKIAGTYKADKWCNCPNNISATVSPEAGRDRRFPRLRQEHAEWTSPVNNHVLFEAVGLHLFERWGNMHYRVHDGSLDDPAIEAVLPQLYAIMEQGGPYAGLNYGVLSNYNNTAVPSFTYRAAMSYVTGSHALKYGFNRTHGYLDENQYTLNPVALRFGAGTVNGVAMPSGVPNLVTERPTYRVKTNLDNDLGFYAQDRWTVSRFTVQGALRFDYFATSVPEQHLGPEAIAPTRNITFPAQDLISWKDLTYRTGFAYDIFGTGKTALKVGFNKYLLGQTLNGLGRDPNPIVALPTNATRGWNDYTFGAGDPRSGNYRPDCDIANPLANGECAQINNLAFGTSTLPSTDRGVPGPDVFDKDLISGFNHRQANWEFSTSVQHELMPGMALDVGYFRRAWAHFRVTDNLLVSPADYTRFDIVAPSNPNLPGGGGYTIHGFYDVNPAKFGQVRNLNALSDDYGHQYENFNGVDVTVNSRLKNGITVQAGVSTGKTMEDNCEIVEKLPEMNFFATGVAPAVGTLPASWRPAEWCHRESPFLTQFKMYGVYVLPKVDVQVSGSFRSLPGQIGPPAVPPNTDVQVAFTATNAFLNANSTLGRALAGNSPSVNLQLLEPYTTYLDRRNELDLRFGKVLRFAKQKAVVSLDVFNALNSNARITVNQSYAAYPRPTEILNARLLKISVAYDF